MAEPHPIQDDHSAPPMEKSSSSSKPSSDPEAIAPLESQQQQQPPTTPPHTTQHQQYQQQHDDDNSVDSNKDLEHALQQALDSQDLGRLCKTLGDNYCLPSRAPRAAGSADDSGSDTTAPAGHSSCSESGTGSEVGARSDVVGGTNGEGKAKPSAATTTATTVAAITLGSNCNELAAAVGVSSAVVCFLVFGKCLYSYSRYTHTDQGCSVAHVATDVIIKITVYPSIWRASFRFQNLASHQFTESHIILYTMFIYR